VAALIQIKLAQANSGVEWRPVAKRKARPVRAEGAAIAGLGPERHAAACAQPSPCRIQGMWWRIDLSCLSRRHLCLPT